MKKLKIASCRADNVPVKVDLFGDGATPAPRPAWQVIEAARRQFLTGELVLATEPPTHVYLRDGDVYFAERSTDGGLGVRLLVEGVITRAQLQKGTLLVSGTEHLGRLFERDLSIEREPVELCVELMTDDVLVTIAEDIVPDYRLTLYRRHGSGIDRWLPRKVEVISRLVERAEHADPDDRLQKIPAPVPGRAPLSARPMAPISPVVAPATPEPLAVAPTAAVDAPPPAAPTPEQDDVSTLATTTPATTPADDAPAPALPLAPAAAPEPVAAAEPIRLSLDIEPVAAEAALAVPAPFEPSLLPAVAPHLAAEQAFTPMPAAPSPLLTPLPLTSPASLLETSAPLTPAALLEAPTIDDDGISLAHSAVEAIMSTAIAEEVAEAVRRALQAIDAVATPVAPVTPADVLGSYSPEPSPSVGT